MKPRLFLIPLIVVATALGQEPSAKDLRTLLRARVTNYANDGHLVASWSFLEADQLGAFKRLDETAIKLVPKEGLSLASVAGGHDLCFFKELEFEQPCRIELDLRLENAASAFELHLIDPANPGSRILIGVNTRMFARSRGGHDVIARLRNGALDGTPRSARSAVAPDGWTHVSIEVKAEKATLTVARTEQAALDDLGFRRFGVAFAAGRGKAMIRNLAVDTQVNRDSVRKLFRSVAVGSASRPKEGDVASLAEKAWGKIEEEFGTDELSFGATNEIEALPQDARKAVETGLSIERRRREGALDRFEAALALVPDSAVVLWLAGSAAREAAPEKALPYLEKSVAADPSLAAAWAELGEARGEAGDYARAKDALDRAETLDSASARVDLARIRVAIRRGSLADARRDLDKALAKRPDSEALKLLATTFERLAARPDWKDSFKKENSWYCVETTISSKVAADLAQRLVVYRRFLEKAFPLPLQQTPAPSRVWIFDSEDEYHRFASSIASGMDGTVGLYHKLIKTLLLTSKVSSETTQHILFHEGFHQYLDLAVSQPPIWMNEGLAEYFGATTFDVTGKATEGGLVAMRIPTLRAHLVPLRALMLMSPGAFMNPRTASLHYAQSWALVHYFKQGGNAEHARLFDLYCAAVIEGKSQRAAFDATFGKDGGAALDGIESAFRAYVRTRLLTVR